MTDRSTVLRSAGLKKIFKKEQQQIEVLRGVDFTIRAGEVVSIVGPSGAGKSTLLHILGTLEKPSAGKVFFGESEEDIFAWKDEELSEFRNRALGFVFQFHYLLPEFTALENVMMPALIAGYARSPSEKQAKELLEFVGLSHRLTHRPSELSGGEQQRVAIARAIMLRPKLLLADELTGNLDSVNREAVMDLLAQLNRSTGIAILLVTHDVNVAKKTHRVVEMRDGAITADSAK